AQTPETFGKSGRGRRYPLLDGGTPAVGPRGTPSTSWLRPFLPGLGAHRPGKQLRRPLDAVHLMGLVKRPVLRHTIRLDGLLDDQGLQPLPEEGWQLPGTLDGSLPKVVLSARGGPELPLPEGFLTRWRICLGLGQHCERSTRNRAGQPED